MRSLTIHGQAIPAGEVTELNLPVAMLPTHTQILLPLFVYRGTADGPVLLLTAGLHGDEVNGTETIRRMMRTDRLVPEAGTVIAMPIVNVYGFLHQSRDLPDGKDLNRSFPGSKRGSLARQLAHLLLNEVVVHVDCGIDLHTGGSSRSNFPQVRCDFTRRESLDLARAFGAPLLLHSREIAGSFRKAGGNLGKNIIVFEGGEANRIDEVAIKEGISGIERVMAHLGMIPERVAPQASQELEESQWLRASFGGMFVPVVPYGAEVKAGQVLATLGDPYGEVVREIKAPSAGFIIGLNNHPVVHAGDAVIHFGG
ncbi:MAG: succinylglutamate desuccinylase/aspartoacylase family protein [Bacteroidota bacterium]